MPCGCKQVYWPKEALCVEMDDWFWSVLLHWLGFPCASEFRQWVMVRGMRMGGSQGWEGIAYDHDRTRSWPRVHRAECRCERGVIEGSWFAKRKSIEKWTILDSLGWKFMNNWSAGAVSGNSVPTPGVRVEMICYQINLECLGFKWSIMDPFGGGGQLRLRIGMKISNMVSITPEITKVSNLIEFELG